MDKSFIPKAVALATAGLFVVILLATSVYIVDLTDQAVITRFGRYIDTKRPGLHFRLPLGIDRKYTVNVMMVHTQEFGSRTEWGKYGTFASERESAMLSGDLNIVDVEWIIQYRIVDPKAWIFNVDDRVAAIRDVSRSTINMLVGDRAVLEILGSQRDAIQAAGMDIMNETLRGYGLGVNVMAVMLRKTSPSGYRVPRYFREGQ